MSLKSGVYFILRAHLNLDELHFIAQEPHVLVATVLGIEAPHRRTWRKKIDFRQLMN